MATRVKKAPSLLSIILRKKRKDRKTLARIRFKAAVRLVIANLYWMEGEEEEVTDDVMKNIQLLSRKKIYKSDLTLAERSILNTPTEYRRDEDKQTLDRAIGGLKCFRRYPSTSPKAGGGVVPLGHASDFIKKIWDGLGD
ncbi:hypothetical protein NQ318_010531 [Aromia moschata]|uniref:Uncharacterized protein n=1 Tax=Aromia moschata TaxID=1265417 RepID=A0AAV8YFC7_9CUCU|nr:hypothetical protein NQ318_010531 [Aromia moschata]